MIDLICKFLNLGLNNFSDKLLRRMLFIVLYILIWNLVGVIIIFGIKWCWYDGWFCRWSNENMIVCVIVWFLDFFVFFEIVFLLGEFLFVKKKFIYIVSDIYKMLILMKKKCYMDMKVLL